MISGTREPAGCAWNEVAETPPTMMGAAVVLAIVLPMMTAADPKAEIRLYDVSCAIQLVS